MWSTIHYLTISLSSYYKKHSLVQRFLMPGPLPGLYYKSSFTLARYRHRYAYTLVYSLPLSRTVIWLRGCTQVHTSVDEVPSTSRLGKWDVQVGGFVYYPAMSCLPYTLYSLGPPRPRRPQSHQLDFRHSLLTQVRSSSMSQS